GEPATKTAPRKARVDLKDVIHEVVLLVRSELQRHDVSLTTELLPTLPPVFGDPIQLQQVILNLVMNAIEAMAPVTDRPRELVIRSLEADREQGGVAVAH